MKKLFKNKIFLIMLLILLVSNSIMGYYIYSYRREANLTHSTSLKVKEELIEVKEDLETLNNDLSNSELLLNTKTSKISDLESEIETLKKVNKRISLEIEDLKNSNEVSNSETKSKEITNTIVDTTVEDTQSVVQDNVNKEVKIYDYELKESIDKQVLTQGYYLTTYKNKVTVTNLSNELLRIKKVKFDGDESYLIETMDGDVFTIYDDIFISTEDYTGDFNQRFNIEFLSDSHIIITHDDKYLQFLNGNVYLSENKFAWKLTDNVDKKGVFDFQAQRNPEIKGLKYSWKDLGGAGCGLFSLTMILNYAMDTPADFMDIYNITRDNGFDILESPRTDMKSLLKELQKTYSFNYKEITTDEVINQLKSGNEVLIASWPNDLINYYGKGHYFVLRGITDDGKLIVIDPYYKGGTNYHSYDEHLEEKYVLDNEEFSFKTEPWKMFDKAFEVYVIWDK